MNTKDVNREEIMGRSWSCRSQKFDVARGGVAVRVSSPRTSETLPTQLAKSSINDLDNSAQAHQVHAERVLDMCDEVLHRVADEDDGLVGAIAVAD